jgi:hypothetical protein
VVASKRLMGSRRTEQDWNVAWSFMLLGIRHWEILMHSMKEVSMDETG